jgi:predicted phosphodiesterase
MIVQYMSDLHLEFASMPVPDVAGDVLVLAGDIHLGANAIPWIEQCAQKFDHVIYILGNHEYYGQKMWKLPGLIEGSLAGYSTDDLKFPDAETKPKLTKIFDPITNVYFLDNDTIKIGDVNFIGSTLWSKPDIMLKYIMSDFIKIKYKYKQNQYGKFSPEAAYNLFLDNKQFIKNSIVPGEKNVVITHHAPSFEMINLARYGDSYENTGYATEILHEFNPEDINLWISGHTHGAYSKVISGIHSVSNCRGYVPYEETEGFNPVAIVEV